MGKLLCILAVVMIAAGAFAASAQTVVPPPETDRALTDGKDQGMETLAELLAIISDTEVGTAGSSLKQAGTAFRILRFCADQPSEFRETADLDTACRAALDMLDPAEREAFDAVFPMVSDLIDTCFENRGLQSAVFEDAGLKEAMEEILKDPQVLVSWPVLRDSLVKTGCDE